MKNRMRVGSLLVFAPSSPIPQRSFFPKMQLSIHTHTQVQLQGINDKRQEYHSVIDPVSTMQKKKKKEDNFT